jgi:hypothetical protein
LSQIEGIDIGVGGSNLQINDGGSEGLLSGICNAIYEVIDTLSNDGYESLSTAGFVSSTTTASGPNQVDHANITTESTSCPPIYKPNAFYKAFARVTNPSDESFGKTVYECRGGNCIGEEAIRIQDCAP